MREILVQLKIAGCRKAYLDGSFATDKTRPRDFDLCWDPRGVDPMLLDPVLLDCRPPRFMQKAKYGGEATPSSAQAAVGYSYLQFFQQDTNTGDAKGIIAIDLSKMTI